MSAPKCINCTHIIYMERPEPFCAHSQAPRDLVNGETSRRCRFERGHPYSYCGPDGLGFVAKESPAVDLNDGANRHGDSLEVWAVDIQANGIVTSQGGAQ